MRILVYGAGNIGSLYAALLKEAGEDVSLLARGKRLDDIREQGILLEEFGSGKQTTTHVKTVARLDPGDAYDLVLVILPRNHVQEVLPILAKNHHTPSVMFLGNNAAGAMVEALGHARVFWAFQKPPQSRTTIVSDTTFSHSKSSRRLSVSSTAASHRALGRLPTHFDQPDFPCQFAQIWMRGSRPMSLRSVPRPTPYIWSP